MGETLRTPPALGPRVPKTGSLMVDDYDFRVAEPLLDTYSPFPTFGSGDPLGLNAFLLHPSDPTFDYLLTRPIPGEVLPADQHAKVPPGLFSHRLAPSLQPPGPTSKENRRRSPLALECKPEDEGDDVDDHAENGGVTARLRPLSVGNSLRAMIGRKSAAPEAESLSEDDPAYVRSESVSSALSSGSSTDGSDGLRTPRDSSHNSPDETSAAAARLAAALADDDERRPKSVSWRNWLGPKTNSKRASFLPFRSDDNSGPSESGTTLQESPRASAIDLASEAAFPEGISRSAIQLRRVSLNKLGSLRMPSPHPLADVLGRQRANLPDEVAFSIPSSKRVFPSSVNTYQSFGSDLMPAQGGLRLALGVRNVIAKLDSGERPPELSATPLHKGSRTIGSKRRRGVRDFVNRKPFEERMLDYHPDGSCSQISMARSGFAIEDLDFSDHILALMRGQETPASSSAPSLSQRSNSGPTRSQSANDLLSTRPEHQNRKSTMSVATKDARPVSSFRKSMKPSTWEDSSDDEEDEDDVPPSRPAALRSQTAPARVLNKNAVNRVSRVMDAQTALETVTKARERRQDFNSGNVERRQVGADLTREQRRKSMMVPSASTSALDKKSGARPATQQRPSTMAIAAVNKNQAGDRVSRNPRARASSATLADRAREDAHAEAAAKLTANKTGRSERAKRSPAPSLPSSPQSRSQDGRRVVSQMEPPLRARQSTMTLGMYPMSMAPVPTVAMYGSPMMGQPMMFTPMVPMVTGPMQQSHHPSAMYSAPYGARVPNMPNYRPRPPATGRRRERPVA